MDSHVEDEAKKKLLFLLISVVFIKFIQNYHNNSIIYKRISKYGSADRYKYLQRIYSNDRSSIIMVRMNRSTFAYLVKTMRERHLLRDTIHVTIEEQLMMFLHVLGHNKKNRVIGHNFLRSGATVSKYFGNALRAIVALKDDFMPPPDSAISERIKNDRRMWPFFKDCIGAIDGTHIPARVTSDIVARFHGRYKGPTQNVLAAIRFDRTFSYVLAGWEGSVNDRTLLRNTLERPNGLQVPSGKYFLGDAGFFMRPGFLLPYRGTRYHRKDFSENNPPRNAKELFNLRDSSLRTTIECTFGILKQRFRIIDGYSNFVWSEEKSAFLITCLVTEAAKGMKVDKTFKRQAFVAAAKAVSEKFEEACNWTKVENRLKTLKKKWSTIMHLKNLSGSNFDPVNKIITLGDGSYQDFVKAHPKDALYLNVPIQFHDELAIICGEDQVTGEFTLDDLNKANLDDLCGSDEDADNTNCNEVRETQEVPRRTNVQGRRGRPSRQEDDQSSPDAMTPSRRSEGRKHNFDGQLVALVGTLEKVAESMVDATTRRKEILLAAIKSHTIFSEQVHLEAYKHCLRNEEDADLFLARSSQLQEDWLYNFVV